MVNGALLDACAKHLQPNGSIKGSEVANVVREFCPTFLSALHDESESDVIRNVAGNRLRHGELHRFIADFGKVLHQLQLGRGDKVAILLPNGPVLAVALASLINWTTCIPLNIKSTTSELADDVRKVGAVAVFGLASFHQLAEDLDIQFAEIRPADGKVGLFDIVGLLESKKVASDIEPNTLSDNALLLFTSGTTGNKRIVPHSLENVLTGAALIATTWGLGQSDTCFNMMPLYHVGGILRQVIAPLVSGGCVVCGECFDPFLFWELLEQAKFTWYYAAPTMHHVILENKPEGFSKAGTNLRFLANAAGGLSPRLALKLSRSFQNANVLPSYGSTECMPITSPPSSYRLDKPGTSGIAVGPELKIVDPKDKTVELPAGSEGCICIRGPPCFPGYLDYDNKSVFLDDGYFDTGDLGHLDEDGYLFISGRTKEVINRGGEIISPMEVEEAVSHHPHVASCMAFSANHEILQEVVGIAVVLREGATITLVELQGFVHERLSQPKWPQCLVVIDDLPKSHTNKILRVRFGHRLGIQSIDDVMPLNKRTFKAMCPEPGTPLSTEIQCEAVSNENDLTVSLVEAETEESSGPSNALNGVRFVVGFFVVFGHIGAFPSVIMLKLQAYSLAMQVFFFLASFQMSCKIKNEVLSTWSIFVGSKIGALHALFAVSQFIAIVPYFLFQCGENAFDETFNNRFCNANHALAKPLSLWTLNTMTGLVGSFTFDQVNSTNWFMGVLYTYIVAFPLLHCRLQRFRSTPDDMLIAFLVAAVLAIAFPGLIFLFFGFFELNYTIVTWIPSLLAASIAGSLFSYLKGYGKHSSVEPRTNLVKSLLVHTRNPHYWGMATDAMSVVFIVLAFATALSPRCLYVDEESFESMRPGNDLPTHTILSFDQEPMYWVCNVSYDEWYDHIRATCGSGGRWVTQMSKFFRFGRFGSPFVWLWLFGMAFGHGRTAKLMKNPVLQKLSPLAYPMYLLHLPIAQLYWLATRGPEAEEWWDCPGNVAVPVHWYELLGIVGMCLALGYLLDRFLLPHLIPHTIRFGVSVCRRISSLFPCSKSSTTDEKEERSSFTQVAAMIRAGSGIEVTREANLSDTGLDSLGLTALLGNLRASVPSARKKKLTLQRLAEFQTVGELSLFLDRTDDGSDDIDSDCLNTSASDTTPSSLGVKMKSDAGSGSPYLEAVA